MRNLKKTITAAVLLISFSAAGAALGNGVSAASLEAKSPSAPSAGAGRDYRIALLNAEHSDGPVIHKPMQGQGRPEGTPARGFGEMRNRPRDGSGHHYEGRHTRRLKETTMTAITTKGAMDAASTKITTMATTAMKGTMSAALREMTETVTTVMVLPALKDGAGRLRRRKMLHSNLIIYIYHHLRKR